jgi:hypothetical protein
LLASGTGGCDVKLISRSFFGAEEFYFVSIVRDYKSILIKTCDEIPE